MASGDEIRLLTQLFVPDESKPIAPEAAKYLLSLSFSQRDRDRFTELSGKANEGTLSPEEAWELEAMDNIRHLLIQMKARARLALKKSAEVAA